jgi:hypothetical protein
VGNEKIKVNPMIATSANYRFEPGFMHQETHSDAVTAEFLWRSQWAFPPNWVAENAAWQP